MILEEASVARDALRIYDGETEVNMEAAAKNPAFH